MKLQRISLFLLGVLLLGLTACQTAVSPLTDADQAAIYSAAVRQVVTIDDTFGGTLNPPIVYIVSQTNDSIGDPEIESLPSVALSTSLQYDISTGLGDLSAKVVWVNGRDDVTIDPNTGALIDEGVLVTLGNIHPQDDGSVQLSAGIYIAGLAAGGQTYILEQIDDQWTITGNTGVQWIS
ncbi:MAG: hypothetical protein KC421_19840 [Anaerolineales bacterium]|nr:hypothetical protein [Anaerolineales bacterium]